jgi:hypothetical protein
MWGMWRVAGLVGGEGERFEVCLLIGKYTIFPPSSNPPLHFPLMDVTLFSNAAGVLIPEATVVFETEI